MSWDTLKQLKHWCRYYVVVAGACGKESDNINFGLLSLDPWNMYPNWISSNECSDANYMVVSSDLGSGPNSGEPLYYVPVGFNIQQKARTKSKGHTIYLRLRKISHGNSPLSTQKPSSVYL